MMDAIFLSDQVRLHETILVLCVKINPTGLLSNIRQLHEHKIHTASPSQAKTVFRCTDCQQYLCIREGSTCWIDYHIRKHFWH